MKTTTITKEIQVPLLEIYQDEFAESPRNNYNIGMLIMKNYKHLDDSESDGTQHSDLDYDKLSEIIDDTYESAKSGIDHVAKIQKAIGKNIIVYPINKYEHGNIRFSISTSEGFDNGVCGFYFVSKKNLKDNECIDESKALSIIVGELEILTSYTNGEVYGYTLRDTGAVIIDGCCGFYDLDDIKSDLGVDWKDENMIDYLI